MDNRNILIVGIVNDIYECSISFTTTIIRLQQRIASQGQHACPVGFEFFRSAADAIEHFKHTPKYTRLVIMDACMGCDIDFILRPREADVVVAAYPMRSVDFERVAKYIETCRNDGKEPVPSTAQTTGITYNFKTEAGSDVDDEGCVMATDPQARIVSISRDRGIDVFMDAFDQTKDTLRGTFPVDVRAKCTNTGLYDFSGTVATRFVTKDVANVKPN
mgnify:CR=1 FL=1